jgi:class 3 adenylate cyclase/acyl-coenzyme A thioesterase PaaI-like protein
MQTFDGTVEFRILMEVCLNFAVLTGAPAGAGVRPAAMTVNNFRPCTVESETLVARGQVLNSGPTFTLAEVLVEDASGRRVAHGVGTYFVAPIEPPPPLWSGSGVAIEPPTYSTPDPYRRPLDPLALPSIDHLSGLNIMQSYVRGEISLGPVLRLLGTKVVLAEEGEIALVFPASEWFCVLSKEVSPGVLAAFAHHVLGAATGTLCPPAHRIGILDQAVTFLAPVVADGRELVGRGRVTHRRGDLVVDTAEFTNADGHVVVVGHQTSMIRPPRKRSGAASPVERRIITVLFSDIVKSTERAAELGDASWTELLARHHALVRRQLQLFKGVEVKTTGDGFLATFESPGQAIQAARAIRDGVRSLGLEIRVGIHTGECEISKGDVAGIAVHIASRVQALADAGEVLLSGTVHDLVTGSGLPFTDRGRHPVKGVQGEWQIYALADSSHS